MYGVFLIGDIVSILLGFAAESLVLVLYIKIRSPKLLHFLISGALTTGIVAVLAFDAFCGLTGYESAARDSLWHSINYMSCGLCVSVPRMFRPRAPLALARGAETAFTVAAGLLFAAQAAFDFAGERPIWMYIATFSLLSLALLYFALSLIGGRHPRDPREPALRHYNQFLELIGAVALILLPAFLIVDFFGWILPWPGDLIPRGMSMLPAFNLVMSAGMAISAALELLEQSSLLAPVDVDPRLVDTYQISRREAEVLPLLLQCLSYKEIGERLFIAPGTVRTHVIHIYQKTGASGRLELARLLGKDEAP